LSCEGLQGTAGTAACMATGAIQPGKMRLRGPHETHSSKSRSSKGPASGSREIEGGGVCQKAGNWSAHLRCALRSARLLDSQRCSLPCMPMHSHPHPHSHAFQHTSTGTALPRQPTPARQLQLQPTSVWIELRVWSKFLIWVSFIMLSIAACFKLWRHMHGVTGVVQAENSN